MAMMNITFAFKAESPLPTRVLGISGEDPVLANTAEKVALYTILTYCWGA
jgi:hypothetical protein